MDPSKTCNYAVVESTYGDVIRAAEKQDSQTRREELRLLLDQTIEQNGALVLPAFSIARTQDLMFDLHWVVADGSGKYDRLRFLLDSPLARKVHPVNRQALQKTERSSKGKVRARWLGKQFFRDLGLDDANPADIAAGQSILGMVFDDAQNDQLRGIATGNQIARDWRPIFRSAEEARQARHADLVGPTVIVTSSGTCDGGPVVQWLSALLSLKTTTVAMTGHCSQSTVAGQLLAIAHVPLNERVRDSGSIALPGKEPIPVFKVQASIYKVNGYSAHADQNDLLNWLLREREGVCNLAAREVFIQHGEDRHRKSLASALRERARLRQLDVLTHLPSDPELWWSLERSVGSNIIDLVAERSRIEQEILALQSRLRAMG
nr:MBL fold metallo-hydrolase RNA specificity domain-containing protein [Methyloversatilis sp. XJ19-49]